MVPAKKFSIRSMSKAELAAYYGVNTMLLLSWLRVNKKFFDSLQYKGCVVLQPWQVKMIVEKIGEPGTE